MVKAFNKLTQYIPAERCIRPVHRDPWQWQQTNDTFLLSVRGGTARLSEQERKDMFMSRGHKLTSHVYPMVSREGQNEQKSDDELKTGEKIKRQLRELDSKL